jgi:signal peptidase I
MKLLKKKIGKQGRWPTTMLLLFLPVILILCFRWFLFEPFVIPSESMLPNLMIHDHIAVKKWSYGIKPPVGDGWILRFHDEPHRGDVVVFRFPENRNVFYIKRLIGLPGDKIKTQGMNLFVNNQLIPLEPTIDENQYIETIDGNRHVVRFADSTSFDQEKINEITVPPQSFFVMGDNRYNSYDSRFWGFVPEELLVGRAVKIWLSCEETLESMAFLCNPMKLRKDRFFKDIQ